MSLSVLLLTALSAFLPLATSTRTPSLRDVTDGNWGAWTTWTPCTATCGGGGVRVRSRICQPADQYGKQICTRPRKAAIETDPCEMHDCAEGFLSVIPLGCWKVIPAVQPAAAQIDQSPGKCAQACQNQGYQYSAIDQTITDQSSVPGTCYCMNTYTTGGRSNRCNTVCKDLTPGSSKTYFGYLCGFSGGEEHASVYAVRGSTPVPGQWGDWSPCDCATGTRQRSRPCYASRGGAENCDENLSETESCNASTSGGWSSWSSWSDCSLSCGGGGLQTRTRSCQGPCGGEITQTCPFAGEVERDEKQCGFAACLQSDYIEYDQPATPLGCWDVPTFDRSIETFEKNNNPGFCVDRCYDASETGYVALDMSSDKGEGVGYCACLTGDAYNANGPRTGCNRMCGGTSAAFPGYLCGSDTPFVATIYRKPGATSTWSQWSAWSDCNCPLGQTRRRICQYSPITFQECQAVGTLVEQRDCIESACLQCPGLPTLENGVIGGDSINGIGAVKRFTCNPGYSRIGPSVIRCTFGGIWGADPPVCQDNACPTLQPLQNGNVTTVPGSEGNLITFSCNDGYKLIGPIVLYCDQDGYWNGTQPLCLSPPEIIGQNMTSMIDTEIDTLVNMTCFFAGSLPLQVMWWVPTLSSPLTGSEDGYIITTELGNETVNNIPVTMTHLQINKVTSEMIGQFICAADNGAGAVSRKTHLNALCPQLPPVQHGRREPIPGNEERGVTVICNPGFILIGNADLQCENNGKWNDTQAVCQAQPKVATTNATKTVDSNLHSAHNISCLFDGSLPIRNLWWTPTRTSPLSENDGPYKLWQTVQGQTEQGVPIVLSLLGIDNVTAEMEGLFICGADNSAGVTSAKVNLRVNYPRPGPERQLSVGEEYGQYIAIGFGLATGLLIVIVIGCAMYVRRIQRGGYHNF